MLAPVKPANPGSCGKMAVKTERDILWGNRDYTAEIVLTSAYLHWSNQTGTQSCQGWWPLGQHAVFYRVVTNFEVILQGVDKF